MSDTQKDFYKKLLGKTGERLTCKTLKKAGYKVVLKNYVTRYGEADIVAEKDGETVFVEVKTRSGDSYGAPKDAVNYKKQDKYRKIAACYMQATGKENVTFAVAEVSEGKVDIIFNAF